MPDETPQTAAPAPVAEQPAAQAVETTAPAQTETQAAPAAEAATAPEKLWANKYKAPEILEEAYLHSQAENTRMAQRLAEMEKAKTTAPTPPTPTTYSPEQLETWKEQWLAEGYKNPEKAQEAAHQVRLIDAELRRYEVNQFASKQTAAQAFERLKADFLPVIKAHEADLQPGMPIWQDAQAIHKQALLAGQPDNEMSATASLFMALVKSGKLTTATQKASAEATKNLNAALKSAAAAGSGAANQNAAPQQDWKEAIKTPEGKAKFREYRKSLGVGS